METLVNSTQVAIIVSQFVANIISFQLWAQVHTYIRNWSLKPFSQDYWPSFSHHLRCCINFIYKWRDLQFKVDSERQIFWETFHKNFICLLSEFLPEICWEEIAEEILIVFCFDVWSGCRTLGLRLRSQHTTY